MSLVFDNVIFKSAGKTLLGPLRLDAAQSGITAILGPNGAGKSLFLELSHGMITPSSGHVTWDGVPATKNKRSRGYIFQHRITLRRSVADNIALPLLAAGWSKTVIKSRTQELLEIARLTNKANEPANILSGGEAQRMALARALALNPKTLIMDEPTSSLDPVATETFEEVIKDVAQSGVSIFWATHNLIQARKFANTVIFIANGEVQEYCESDQFFSNPTSDAGKQFLTGGT